MQIDILLTGTAETGAEFDEATMAPPNSKAEMAIHFMMGATVASQK
jgi:hypothetical protein